MSSRKFRTPRVRVRSRQVMVQQNYSVQWPTEPSAQNEHLPKMADMSGTDDDDNDNEQPTGLPLTLANMNDEDDQPELHILYDNDSDDTDTEE